MKTENAKRPAAWPNYYFILIGVFLMAAAILAVPFYSASSSSLASDKAAAISPLVTPSLARTSSRWANYTGGLSSYQPFAPLVPQAGAEDIATFDFQGGNCTTTPRSQFTTGDTVCVRVSNISVQRKVYWVNPDDHVVQIDTVSPTSTDVTRAVVQVGKWRAYLVDASDGSARKWVEFSVSDPQNPAVDLSLQKVSDATYTAGGFARYTVSVVNNGPDAAAMVQLTETTPNSTTFVAVTQDAGIPVFVCTNGTSSTVCTADSLAAGAGVSFTFVYTVAANASVGTLIVNQANVTSQTQELNPADNTATLTGTVVSTGGTGGTVCSLGCPDDITTQANTTDQNNNPGAVVHFSPPSGNDECGVIVVDHCNDCFFPVGTTTVTATATTGDSCSFKVIVTPPASGTTTTVTCPANQSGNADNNCKASFSLGTATATGTNVTLYASRSDGELVYTCDDFGNCTRTSSDAPFTYGVTTITWYAFSHDIAGPYDAQTGDEESRRTGSASCTQTITVNDVTAPTIAATNQSASADANCQAPVPDYSSTVSDNCSSNITYTQTPAAGTLVGLGPQTVHIEANDNSSNNNGAGNAATKDVTFTVNDTTAPAISCPANITTSNDSGQCSAMVNPGTATATDNCDSSPTISGTRSDNQSLSAPYPKGTTTITWTAIDHSGNLSSCTQTVTVNDTENPTITAPSNVTANTGPGRTTCDADVSNATLGTASANDNCPGVTVSRSPSGNTFPVGTTTITWTATDTSGNTATATQTVTVNDNTPPVVTPPANVTAYTGPGATSCGTFVSDATLGTASATDNCPGVSGVTRSGVPSGNFFPVGTTTITYSATDAHSNTGTATQTVTVIDNTPPVISCPASQTLEPTCPSGAVGNWTPPVGTDNCPGAVTTRTAGPAPGSVFGAGTTTTITYTVNDAHGNSASCSFTVTVKTVTQTIEDLKTSVNNSSLSPSNKGGLVSKLQAAEDALAAGHTNTACTKLADFINSVQNLINHGDISAAQGNAWISTATHLRNAIGCTNDPCS